MKKYISSLALAFALLLPIHGAITVFLPDFVRYWKEGFLLILGIYWVITEIQLFIKTKKLNWSYAHMASLIFVLFSGLLAVMHKDVYYGVLAWRYLTEGLTLFLILSRLIECGKVSYTQFMQKFSTLLVFSTIVSTLFGFWSKFLGGAKVLTQFYSDTVSSWVPGQTLQIYHQAGDFVRMQGATSGPVAFGHIALLAFYMVRFTGLSILWRYITKAILLWGMYQSGSRAVMGAVVLLMIYDGYMLYKRKITKPFIWGALGVILVSMVGAVYLGVPQKVMDRAGTSEHFTRPVEVYTKALESPWVGQIAEVGPAKRAENLKYKNDDKAPIAENVFIDIFAQTGIIGLVLYIMIWRGIFRTTKRKEIVVLIFILTQMATIFDMMPVNFLVWSIFALVLGENSLNKKSIQQ